MGVAGAYVDDVGVRRRHRERTNRRDRLPVENRIPGSPGVGGLPDASPRSAEVVRGRIAGNPGDGVDAPATERTDEPISQSAKHIVRNRAGVLDLR